MVLTELGRKITRALKRMDDSTTVNEKVIKKILGEIGMALLQADVSIQYVKKLKDNVQMQFKLSAAQGANLRRIVQRAVVDELTNMLEAEKKPFQPKKGKSNVIMFVGLQGLALRGFCTILFFIFCVLSIKKLFIN